MVAKPRFADVETKEVVRRRCIDLLRSFMSTPAARENPRVALKLLSLAACYPEGRQVRTPRKAGTEGSEP